ncbi:ABC transporter permease [Phocicoccus pinnipedialis]|uniref:Bacterial ABC transporter protein EcsB n=1 Tax=Phocicoccus pinnipedialis TaxID=110845 RepID=A0A6V7RL87_9BACL|nr:ABC transporter permease [Jeotgalicoccus pinnipedialis]MBP1939593.1 ABC-2 type transport system permease protein [Jeotgalicoccus pinnipedialis]CAD2079072.1 Bacterial ABC transporter protein EcsB [Jeotgalicoccus pinnipedialis]
MFRNIFKTRMDHDIKLRAYYSKYIFNSHFILFLSIAAGVLLYTLLGLKENLAGNIYVDLVAAILMSVAIIPVYRSLLKEADVIFLTPLEKELDDYFMSSKIYSFILGIPVPFVVSAIAFILLIINHSVENSLIIIFTFYLMVIGVFTLKVLAVNSNISPTAIVYMFMIINTILLFLQMQNMMLIILGILIYLVAFIILKKKTRSSIDWLAQIDHEKQEQNRFDTIISMFANVSKRNKTFKRRPYFDVLMKKQFIKHYDQDHMYDYLFHRSFLRDFDLPMIMIRLFILCSIFIIWMSNLYISIIFILFVLYIMILQLQGLYTAQAYLLWPKIWPVSREKIRNSYIRYSKKLIIVISIFFIIVFISIHPAEFYIAIIFPIWALLINKVFSKNVYKKEEALSD